MLIDLLPLLRDGVGVSTEKQALGERYARDLPWIDTLVRRVDRAQRLLDAEEKDLAGETDRVDLHAVSSKPLRVVIDLGSGCGGKVMERTGDQPWLAAA